MITLIIGVVIILALIGIYGPEHDKFEEEMRKQDEEFKETLRQSEAVANTLHQINEDLKSGRLVYVGDSKFEKAQEDLIKHFEEMES